MTGRALKIGLVVCLAITMSCLLCWFFYNNHKDPIDPYPLRDRDYPFSNHTGLDPAFQLELNPNIKIVILFASFRGGSSFLGQIFDQNPAVQYLYEPFHDGAMLELSRTGSLIGSASRHTEADQRMLYLQQILHNCTMFATVFYEKHEFCGSVDEHLARFNSTECTRISPKSRTVQQQEICRYRKTVVLKVIRLQYLSDIMKIQNIKSANIKIIHLTRTPIPMMMSRGTGLHFFLWDHKTALKRSSYREQNRIMLAWETFDYCYKTLQNIRYLESNVWMKERYMRLSHEELSLRPIETAQTVYNFLDMELTENLKEILVNVTSGVGGDSGNSRALKTSKNSKELLGKWKRMISATIKMFDLFTIEAMSSQFLKFLGYNLEMDEMSLPDKNNIYMHNEKLLD